MKKFLLVLILGKTLILNYFLSPLSSWFILFILPLVEEDHWYSYAEKFQYQISFPSIRSKAFLEQTITGKRDGKSSSLQRKSQRLEVINPYCLCLFLA